MTLLQAGGKRDFFYFAPAEGAQCQVLGVLHVLDFQAKQCSIYVLYQQVTHPINGDDSC